MPLAGHTTVVLVTLLLCWSHHLNQLFFLPTRSCREVSPGHIHQQPRGIGGVSVCPIKVLCVGLSLNQQAVGHTYMVCQVQGVGCQAENGMTGSCLLSCVSPAVFECSNWSIILFPTAAVHGHEPSSSPECNAVLQHQQRAPHPTHTPAAMFAPRACRAVSIGAAGSATNLQH